VDGASVYGYALQNPGRWIDRRGTTALTVAGDLAWGGIQIGGQILGGGIISIGMILYPTQLGDGTLPQSLIENPPIEDVCPNDFCEQLALEEAKAGAGRTIPIKLGDEPRIVAHYGLGPWVKKEHTHVCADGRKLVIHYFSNNRGRNVELKFK
ncbi:hypothetical protein, partial [Tabrizicola sp.]|uniref:hypothetical protein n=1 Tax=Tabrizicola sp. TaxID=2005166 RepID=UPI00286A4C4B